MVEIVVIVVSLITGSVSLYSFAKAAQATIILHKK